MAVKKRTNDKRAAAVEKRRGRSRKRPGRAKRDRAAEQPSLIVGLGASAGGLEAFQRFLRAMPADCDAAFVVIAHLDPRQKSALADVLGRATSMEVIAVTKPVELRRHHVYVIAPNSILRLKGNRLVPEPRREGAATPINDFLLSLASEAGARAVSIILSGTGCDGTLGLRAVKEAGGLTIAQASESAQYPGMPRSAVATGLVDMVLRAEDMPSKLLDYGRRLERFEDGKGKSALQDRARRYLTNICTLLRTKTGHDFSQYKESTLLRRIQRRMQVSQLERVESYIEKLRRDPAEVEALFQDLLIGVTHFFRDRDAFAALESKIIPKLFENRVDDQIRVWVPGCATGEEAYSIAILLREHMKKVDAAPKVQVFATDIDEKALEFARVGVYPESIARDVGAKRLRQFFVSRGDIYQVTKDIREMCVFSVHNLIKDPPFSRLDLVSCRNLLIYMNADLQKRVLPLFHFALRPGRYLFLGPSENVTQHEKFFSIVDSKHRIFRAAAAVAPVLPELPLRASMDKSAPSRLHAVSSKSAGQKALIAQVERTLISGFMPAYVVVNDRYDLIYASAGTGKYLELPAGAPNANVLNMARKGLRLELRAALAKAGQGRHRVVDNDVVVGFDGGAQAIRLVVQSVSIGDDSGSYFLIVFQDIATTQASEELETSREELQSVNEELETVNSELTAKIESLDRAKSDLKNLLESTQIATIFLDRDCHIKNFTPMAKDIFHLIESDIGRPITDIVNRLASPSIQEDVRRVMRTLAHVEKEVQLNDGRTTFIMRILPYRTVGNVIDGVVLTFIDITDRKTYEEERARLGNIVAFSHDAIIGITLDGTISAWNAGAEQVFGYPSHEAVGRPWTMLLPPDRSDDEQKLLDRAKRNELARQHDTTMLSMDGRHIPVSATMSAIKDLSGRIVGVSLIARDITERRQAEERQRLLLAELNHRVKNTLATVLSVANQTLEDAASVAEFRQAFTGRIRALSETQNLLTRTNWAGASIRDLIRAEATPYVRQDGANFRLDGPEILLTPRAALSLALVIHELMTNASKHGALSSPSGRVEVIWSIRRDSNERTVKLEWTESGGPRVKPPTRRGFGRRLIEEGISYELAGRAELAFAPGGLRCRIEVPASDALTDDGDRVATEQ
jgi:two-component system CheB/CheR fusion protein